jgi:hypothetical protein
VQSFDRRGISAATGGPSHADCACGNDAQDGNVEIPAPAAADPERQLLPFSTRGRVSSKHVIAPPNEGGVRVRMLLYVLEPGLVVRAWGEVAERSKAAHPLGA